MPAVGCTWRGCLSAPPRETRSKLEIPARSFTRRLKLARTIADLDRVEQIKLSI
ncbi:MAG: hypothetical protein KAG93_05980 [Desulfuromusa sp.]|nr:hypothetical protein [Desulfuromusa sp.]